MSAKSFGGTQHQSLWAGGRCTQGSLETSYTVLRFPSLYNLLFFRHWLVCSNYIKSPTLQGMWLIGWSGDFYHIGHWMLASSGSRLWSESEDRDRNSRLHKFFPKDPRVPGHPFVYSMVISVLVFTSWTYSLLLLIWLWMLWTCKCSIQWEWSSHVRIRMMAKMVVVMHLQELQFVTL